MPTRKRELNNGEIYHVVIRGIGDALIFKETTDYYRVVISLYEFNNTSPVLIGRRKGKRRDPGSTSKREKMIEILAFCLMPNHIHLLLKQTKERGISSFMAKFGAGYAGYFNRKYDRKGYLFQGRFKAIHIKTNEQFKTVLTYIHANPVSLREPNWKENGFNDLESTINFLENYRWSSYLDYLGGSNFPSLTTRKFGLKVMEGQKLCRDFVNDWLKYHERINWFQLDQLE